MHNSTAKWNLRVGLVVSDESGVSGPELAGISRRASELVDREWRAGDRMSNRVGDSRVLRSSGIRFELLHGDDEILDDRVEASFLEIERLVTKAALKSLTCELTVTLRLYGDEMPPLGLSRGLVKALGEIDADVDFDLYLLTSFRPGGQ